MKLFDIFPENVSTYGQDLDNLFWLILVFAGIAFVLSLFILLKPLITNGASKVKRAEYITGEKRKHFRWITYALVALLLSDFVILYVEHDAWAVIETQPAKTDVHVGVIARQWNWIFVYPGPDGKLGTSDDVYVDDMNSSLHVPVNAVIGIQLRSQDVIHSFFLVNARFKMDVLPGRTVERWFEITKPGKYDISCTQICGVLHSKMRNFVLAESPEKYKQFTDSLYKANAKPVAAK